MAFPMIAATNIGTSNVIKRDHKKKTAELITKYNPIGLIDDHFNTGDDLSDSKFSLGSKVRSVSQQQSRKRIQMIRLNSGKVINATKAI